MMLIIVGIYLLTSAIKNRRPIETARAIIAKPSATKSTLASAEGYEAVQTGAPTLTVGGSGRERNLVRVGKEGLRRLTPREFARLQGFPDSFRIPVSDTQAYKQFGNSVAVPVITAIAENLVVALDTATALPMAA